MPTIWTNRPSHAPTYSNPNFTYNDARLTYSAASDVIFTGRSKPSTGWTNRVAPTSSGGTLHAGQATGLFASVTYPQDITVGSSSTIWTNRTQP